MLRIVFMGSPDFAVPTLEALIAHPDCEVCAVVTQPDKPAGRGRQLAAPPVKLCALDHNIPCYQPEKLKTQEMYDTLSALEPDFFVTIAYGKILRQAFLDIPKIAPVNLHASLLPKYRGAAPVQWAIINGEKETGVCLMKMDAGMDTGPVYARTLTAIADDETPETLFARLSKLSADLLMKHLFDIACGKLMPVPQDGTPTTAPMLQKSLGAISFDTDAKTLDALCRGISTWPTAFTSLNGKRLAIHMTHAIDSDTQEKPGTILGFDPASKSLLVACAKGTLAIHTLQPEGKKKMDAESFFNGYRPAGLVLGYA
ncbi:MAG: methionyl-tRNA formyltransferase [Proteobacteria bacterium]|nr:methionyl-tRNA formyltransferase [Pseudomonadota bacterium]